jgi:hypothetical protein
MENENSINRLTLAFASLLLCAALSSCQRDEQYVITYKSLIIDNPHLARYCYSTTGLNSYEFIDSTSRYHIGDNVKKYTVKK